jgi:hypothetical protein
MSGKTARHIRSFPPEAERRCAPFNCTCRPSGGLRARRPGVLRQRADRRRYQSSIHDRRARAGDAWSISPLPSASVSDASIRPTTESSAVAGAQRDSHAVAVNPLDGVMDGKKSQYSKSASETARSLVHRQIRYRSVTLVAFVLLELGLGPVVVDHRNFVIECALRHTHEVLLGAATPGSPIAKGRCRGEVVHDDV